MKIQVFNLVNYHENCQPIDHVCDVTEDLILSKNIEQNYKVSYNYIRIQFSIKIKES